VILHAGAYRRKHVSSIGSMLLDMRTFLGAAQAFNQ
jgi:hypothetical protein